MRRWTQVALGLVGIVVGFAILFPLAYALTVPEQRGRAAAPPAVPEGTYRVYVVDWSYHTAIVVQQPPGFALGPPGEERAAFLEFAWGDKRFYMDSDFQPQSVYATLVLPTATVLYLDGREDPPSFPGARGVYTRTVNAPTLAVLLAELERTIRHDETGRRVAPYTTHEGYAGQFYPAYGRYLWARDCNWWTVERLRTAGLARSSTGVVFSGQVAGRLLEMTSRGRER